MPSTEARQPGRRPHAPHIPSIDVLLAFAAVVPSDDGGIMSLTLVEEVGDGSSG